MDLYSFLILPFLLVVLVLAFPAAIGYGSCSLSTPGGSAISEVGCHNGGSDWRWRSVKETTSSWHWSVSTYHISLPPY